MKFICETKHGDKVEIPEQQEQYQHYDDLPVNSMFSFAGRIGRTVYFYSFVTFVIYALTVKLLTDEYESLVFLKLAYVPLLWFMIPQNTKRSPDHGKSGWYQLLPLI